MRSTSPLRPLARLLGAGLTAATVAAVSAASPAMAAEPIPAYTVSLVQPGAETPTEINNSGVLIGYRTDASGWRTPLVAAPGAGWSALPLPAGALDATPVDINTAGSIVGVAQLPTTRVGVRWTLGADGYAVHQLPLLAGETSSWPTAINEAGQIVGGRANLLGTGAFQGGWLIDTDGSVRSLDPAVGGPSTPADLNNVGQVVAGSQLLDLSTGAVTNLGALGPSSYFPITLTAINDSGIVLGTGGLRTADRNLFSAFLFRPGLGWALLAGPTAGVRGTDLNERGDVTLTDQSTGPMVHLDGQATYFLNDLLAPASFDAGWRVLTHAPHLNDAGVIAGRASQTPTGTVGAARISPAGALPAPAAPTGLTATVVIDTTTHSAGVLLVWTGFSRLVTGTEIQRRAGASAPWSTIATLSGSADREIDRALTPGVTYDYRVRALGHAGPSDWSVIASATAPSVVSDPIAPSVSLTPVSGTTVSGIVTVTSTATDDTPLVAHAITWVDPFTGLQTELARATTAGTLTVAWDTRGATPGTHYLRAGATDSFGNTTVVESAVTIAAGPQTTLVNGLTLTGTVRKGQASVKATVSVRTSSGAIVSGATVSGYWTRPDGGTVLVQGLGTSKGVSFATTGPRGRWTFTVTAVTATGYRWDPASSTLSRSLTV